MQPTISLDDDSLAKARLRADAPGQTALMPEATQKALIKRESARRLALLGGSEPHLRPVHRRRVIPAPCP